MLGCCSAYILPIGWVLLCEATLLRYVMPNATGRNALQKNKIYYLLINFITYHYKPDLEVSVVS